MSHAMPSMFPAFSSSPIPPLSTALSVTASASDSKQKLGTYRRNEVTLVEDDEDPLEVCVVS